MILYKEACVREFLGPLMPMIEAHWREVSLYKDKIPLEVDAEKYYSLGDAFKLFIALDGEDVIGYASFFISNHIHYKSTKFSDNDAIFVDPSYRGRGVADGLMLYAESQLKADGVSVINVHMKETHPFVGLCDRLGYGKVERIYGKYVGD